MPNGRCYRDGGKSTGAPIRSGKYSKFLKGSILEQFEISRHDANLLSIREDIALIEALQVQRLPHLGDENSSAFLWEAAQEHFFELTRAIEERNPEQVKLSISLLAEVLNNGAGNAKAEHEFVDLAEKKSKLQQNEVKYRQVLRDYAESRYVMGLIALLEDSIIRNVTDPEQLRAIAADFDRARRGSAQRPALDAG